MVIKLACTCASLTPAPRFQGSSSLCPSQFNCINRSIKRHLPYSTFSLSLSLLSLTLHLSVSPHFLSFFQYFPSSLFTLFTDCIHSHSCSLFFPFFFHS